MTNIDWIMASALCAILAIVMAVMVLTYDLEHRKIDVLEENGCSYRVEAL